MLTKATIESLVAKLQNTFITSEYTEMVPRLNPSSVRCPAITRHLTFPCARVEVHHHGQRRHKHQDIGAMLQQSSQSQSRAQPLTTTGLFNRPELSSPNSFLEASKRAQQIVHELVSRIINDRNNAQGAVLVVKRLDRISDALCSIIDTAEAIRHTHPDRRWIEAANQAHQHVTTVMNFLNTNSQLYESLRDALHAPEIASKFTAIEKRVGELLKLDFEKCGIHLPKHDRDQFVALNDRILSLGHAFTMSSSSCDTMHVTVTNPTVSLRGLPPHVIEALTSKSVNGAKAHIPIPSSTAMLVLSHCQNPETRRKVYVALNRGSRETVEYLEEFLKTRYQLAKLLGKEGYGHMWTADKMVQSPENVQQFLISLLKSNYASAESASTSLSKIKSVHENTSTFNAWDRSFYTRYLEWSNVNIKHKPLFPLNTIVTTLSSLLQTLYGIQLEPASISNGETWHQDVTKVYVTHETEGRLAVIYLDLFQRDSPKYEVPAHFTVRGSRYIGWDEDLLIDEKANSRSSWINGRRAETPQRLKSVYTEPDVHDNTQLPIVVLVTNFAKPTEESEPTMLSYSQMETLFHETGHAIHSALARTPFQHISGTRIQMDFVEFPSIFTELFTKRMDILGSMVKSQLNSSDADRILNAMRLAAIQLDDPLDTQHQLLLALVDQTYHSPAISQKEITTTSLLSQLHSQFYPIPFVDSTTPQTQFTHLFPYGAGYYTYFWCRKWAQAVHKSLFPIGHSEGKVREHGERLRNNVLGVGGARDGWTMLNALDKTLVTSENHGGKDKFGQDAFTADISQVIWK